MYNLKIIRCGNKLEVYKSNKYTVREQGKEEEFYRVIKPLKHYKGKQLTFKTSKQEEEKRIKNRSDNLKKTKEKVIRLISCNKDLNTFITLTYSNENMKDFKQSKKDISKLFNKIARDYRKECRIFKYIWCLEYSSNNRLHYHILTNYEVNIKLSKSNEFKTEKHKQLENEFNNRYWKLGIVDIRSLEQENNTNVGLYIAKYITKSMRDLEGYRIYGYSKNLNKPIIEKYMTMNNIESVLKQYSDYELNYSNSYSIGYGNKKGVMTYLNMNKKQC